MNCKTEFAKKLQIATVAISIHIDIDLPNRQVGIELASASNSKINFRYDNSLFQMVLTIIRLKLTNGTESWGGTAAIGPRSPALAMPIKARIKYII